MSLFDFVSEEEKTAYEVQMPDVAEYYKEEQLAFEKEILGVYVSGHPLDEYAAMWKRHISAMTTDFELDEETGELKAKDNTRVTIGGMIIDVYKRQHRAINHKSFRYEIPISSK